MNLEAFEQFLHDNPDVFLKQPELLEIVELHAAPEGTISLAKRQQSRLNEKNAKLSEQLQSLIATAHDNVALQQRVHSLCLRLLDATDAEDLFNTLLQELKEEFSADEVAVRLFADGETAFVENCEANIAQMNVNDAALRCFDTLLAQHQPVCGRLTKAQKAVLFEDKADAIQSVACLPLGASVGGGLLAIGSEDANRFHSDMATDYLHFLGEVFVRAVQRYR
jgi:hypothetical protein